MNQPSYHIELLIAGFGTLLAFAIGAFAIWDMSWFPWQILQSESNNLTFALLLLPLIYTTGIITDRFIDSILGRFFIPKINKKHFGDDRNAYLLARTNIYVKSESLKAVYEYSRMRIRILRCWLLNSFLIGAASIWFIFSPPPPIAEAFEEKFCRFVCQNQWSLAAAVVVVTVFSMVISFQNWRSMTDAECKNLKVQSRFLNEMSSEK